MPSPWQSLGELLAGGGKLDSELALQNATTQNTYRSAQTNQALSDAKLNQEKTLTEAANRAGAERVRALNAEALRAGQGMGDIVAGNFGNSFQATVAGQGAVQEQDFQKTLGDALAPAAERLAASSALKEEVQGPLQTLGANTYYDVTQQVPEVKTTQVGESVIDKNQRGPTTKTPEQIRLEAEARRGGALDATRAAELPTKINEVRSAKTELASAQQSVQKLLARDNLWQAVGLMKPLSKISGTEGANVKAEVSELKSKLMMTAYRGLRATSGSPGPMAVQEWERFRESVSALTEDMTVGRFLQELNKVNQYFQTSGQLLDDSFRTLYPDQEPPSASVPGMPAAGAARAPAGAAPAGAAPQVEEWVRGPDGKLVRAQ